MRRKTKHVHHSFSKAGTTDSKGRITLLHAFPCHAEDGEQITMFQCFSEIKRKKLVTVIKTYEAYTTLLDQTWNILSPQQLDSRLYRLHVMDKPMLTAAIWIISIRDAGQPVYQVELLLMCPPVHHCKDWGHLGVQESSLKERFPPAK